MGKESFSVEKYRVSPERINKGNIINLKLFSAILYLPDSGFYIIELNHFFDTAGHSLHIASGESSISMKAFVNNNHIPGFLIDVLVSCCKETADIDHKVFLCAHPESVEIRADFFKNYRNCFVLVPFLPHFDKVSILGCPGSIEPHFYTVLLSQLRDFLEICH